MEEINFLKLFFFLFLLAYLNKIIICDNNNDCFEYSCEKCNSTNYGDCIKCRYGYILVDGVCPCDDSTCAFCKTGFSGLKICQLCKKGYTLENNECICNIPNCRQCGENKCLICESGFYYNNTTKNCEKINLENKITCNDSNCDICFSELKGACVVCKKGYLTVKGECIKLNHALCPVNYYNSNGYCKPICGGVDCSIEYKKIYNLCASNRCLTCENNILYWWTECDGIIECSHIEGCSRCKSDYCFDCKQGYYLLGGICYRCIKGCSICSNNYNCEYCLSGYELTLDKKCNLTYNFDFDITLYNEYKYEFINKKCWDKNCLSCTFLNNIEKCEKCVNGYGINGDQCTPCSYNCLDCTWRFHGEYCWKCIEGYKINNKGKCSLICSDDNCLDCYINYQKKKICKECKPGFKNNDTICISSTCLNIEGCEECYYQNGTEYCLKCKYEYVWNEDKCSLCSEGCSYCNFNKGKEYCYYCKTDYGKNGEICSKCSNGCRNCNFENGISKCTSCYVGYFLNEGNCTKCSDDKCYSCYLSNGKELCESCKYSGYMPVGDKCIQCSDQYCEACQLINGTEICNSCWSYQVTSLMPVGDKCVRCSDENCWECYLINGKEYCSYCKSRYKAIEDKCVKCTDENCLYCKMNNGTEICTECKTGFVTNGYNCSKCSENCNKCYFSQGQEICYDCKYDYILNRKGECLNCSNEIENCKDCEISKSELKCRKCKNGYKLDKQGNCSLICMDINCITCSKNDIDIYYGQNSQLCHSCEEGYKLEKNECLKCKDNYCIKCDENINICTECYLSEIMKGKCAKDCYSFDEFPYGSNYYHCKYCASNGECLECNDEYTLDDNGICQKKKSFLFIVYIIIIILILVVILIVLCIIHKKRNNLRNQVRIHQNNNNNNNNINNNNNEINIRYQNRNIEQGSSTNDYFYEKNLTDEFDRQKIKYEKSKLCQICKKNGEYISDCGCIVCQEHSNFKSVQKNNENYKICFNCGKMIKNITPFKNNCNICLQDVPFVCHFKCDCAFEVCETCYIKCKKSSKKCPGCRGKI